MEQADAGNATPDLGGGAIAMLYLRFAHFWDAYECPSYLRENWTGGITLGG